MAALSPEVLTSPYFSGISDHEAGAFGGGGAIATYLFRNLFGRRALHVGVAYFFAVAEQYAQRNAGARCVILGELNYGVRAR